MKHPLLVNYDPKKPSWKSIFKFYENSTIIALAAEKVQEKLKLCAPTSHY